MFDHIAPMGLGGRLLSSAQRGGVEGFYRYNRGVGM